MLSWGPDEPALSRQNQPPARPQSDAAAWGGNQAPRAPGNQTQRQSDSRQAGRASAAVRRPALYQPGIVQHIQQKLLTLGYPVPTVSGAWGDNSAAALAKFQEKMGLDPGGDLDELTLLALEMPQVLQGDMPPGADAPVSAQAASSGGAPFSLSPRLTRVLQNKLTEAGLPDGQRLRHLDGWLRRRRARVSKGQGARDHLDAGSPHHSHARPHLIADRSETGQAADR